MQVGNHPKFLDQWISITSNKFVLNVVRGHQLHLQCHLPLFHNFRQYSIKTAPAHYPFIQKEVDELLAKCATEPSTDGADFYSNIFVPMQLGGLCPILSLKQFNHYLHMPIFKIPTIRQVLKPIQQADCAFSVDINDAYLFIPIVKHYCHFLAHWWNTKEPYAIMNCLSSLSLSLSVTSSPTYTLSPRKFLLYM